MRTVDLGVCAGELFEADLDRVAYILPGAFYPSSAPLLWYSRTVVASAHGWSVLQVADGYDQATDAAEWVRVRFEAALGAVGEPSQRVLITKSIASRAAPLAAERNLAGIWLTPLMTVPAVADGLAALSAPTLVIGGSADRTWDRVAAHRADVEVFEVPGGDHTLGSEDPHKSIDMLRSVIGRVDRFFQVHHNHRGDGS